MLPYETVVNTNYQTLVFLPLPNQTRQSKSLVFHPAWESRVSPPQRP